MATFKTPGVYVQEIPTIPSSIAPVATAVPGFVGYTEKAMIKGAQWNYSNGPAPPVRITSLLQFEQIFGLPYHEKFTVTLTNPNPSVITIGVVKNPPVADFVLYYQMQMFFSNGGGVCWVVSVGDYSPGILKSDLLAGIALYEPIDEVTLLLTPEAISLTGSGFRREINDAMLAQCAKLGDRFSVLDVFTTGDVNQDGVDFRNNDVGPDNLKYGAAYYPSLKTPLNSFYLDDEVVIVDNRVPTPSPSYGVFPNNTLLTVQNGLSDSLVVTFTTTDPLDTETLVVDGNTFTAKTTPVAATDFQIVPGVPASTAANLEAVMKKANLTKFIITRNGAAVGIRVAVSGPTTPAIVFSENLTGTSTLPATSPMTGGVNNSSNKELYNRIKAELNTYKLTLYPASSMVGIYSRVDNERGVWQSPANVGVRTVNLPFVLVTAEQQENLNIDSTSGKSINAIRKFVGRGNIVWGARTLAGNDNEWRYVNVRRLFLMIEESVQEATEFVVFEPNTANTWQRVKGMIDAFLTNLWRDGALAGAVPKDAFFVEVGLGTTMTPDDILNGIMNVRIGIAAVRPAEFIILKFSHKLQES